MLEYPGLHKKVMLDPIRMALFSSGCVDKFCEAISRPRVNEGVLTKACRSLNRHRLVAKDQIDRESGFSRRSSVTYVCRRDVVTIGLDHMHRRRGWSNRQHSPPNRTLPENLNGQMCKDDPSIGKKCTFTFSRIVTVDDQVSCARQITVGKCPTLIIVGTSRRRGRIVRRSC